MSKKPLLNGWMCVVLSVAVLFAVTFIWAYQNPYIVRFEMDDNTLEAVKSIDWEAINPPTSWEVNDEHTPVYHVNRSLEDCWKVHVYSNGTLECGIYD